MFPNSSEASLFQPKPRLSLALKSGIRIMSLGFCLHEGFFRTSYHLEANRRGTIHHLKISLSYAHS